MPRKDFYASQIANSTNVVRAGIAKLSDLCVELKANTTWIVTPTKANLSGHISSAIGEAAAKALSQGKPVKLGGVTLTHYTEKTLPFSGDGSPILLCYPPAALLNKVDDLANVGALVVLPWNMAEAQSFIDAHAPTDILTNKASVASSVSNPVVAAALQSLIRGINKRTGISHPSDKARAINTFKILQKGREAYTSSEVRAWLVQNGLDAEDADKIAAIAADPSKFRAGTATGGEWRSDILEQWRAAAKGEDEDA